MREQMSPASHAEIERLTEFTARVGSDPLLTQASTGNSSIKVNDELWIKASGQWMAAALQGDIFIRLNMPLVKRCLLQDIDPTEHFPRASLETAMHAATPHRVVLHAHSVDAIAWAVRADGFFQLQQRLEGLRWQWLPYLPSGMPLARAIEAALRRRPDTDVFILANHGFVIAADDVSSLENLLADVQRRLNIPPRFSHPADYALLAEICAGSEWQIPDDDGVHALGTDQLSCRIVSEGILYPCQAIFSGAWGLEAFQPVPGAPYKKSREGSRPFLIVEKCGVLVSRDLSPAGLAMLSGLAQVCQRLNASAPIRYLTEAEIAGLSPQAVHRYCELANSACLRADKSGLAGHSTQ
jgi:rhamnose utilization protein RhaD (predicted bifunctional aldolase and dehydrogenase)